MPSVHLNNFYKNFLAEKKQQKKMRSLQVIDKKQGQYIWKDDCKLIDFSSNDYLGLSQNPTFQNQSHQYFEQWGTGAVASRLLSGNLSIHQKLEERICQWKGYEKALIFASGYQANVGIISSLADKSTVIFCDKLNHASIIDGIILSRAKLKRYDHLDYEQLEIRLQQSDDKKKIIISESIFSMDGEQADMQTLVNLAKKYFALLIIDDAHNYGIQTSFTKGADVYMATFSKALASFGAMVCTNELIYNYLINTCRSFIYTTAPPPALVQQNLIALEFIQSSAADLLRKKLNNNITKVRQKINQLNLTTKEGKSPIIPVILGDENKTLEAQDILQKKGVYCLAIRPPTVPQGTSRLRLVCHANHTQQNLDILFEALEIISCK